jgi:hypothetical protein
VTVTAEQIRADLDRRAEQAPAPRRRRPAPPKPVQAPFWLHRFEPDREAPVGTQCWRCWGWRDDPRHWTKD